MVLVELIYDQTCPNFNKTRDNIDEAFNTTEMDVEFKEWERSAKDSPDYVRDYGSPTVLVDGKDVSETTPSDGAANCRIYVDSQGYPVGVPSVEIIVSALMKAKGKNVSAGTTHNIKSGIFAMFPSISVVALTPFACPACWPAYIGLLASLGIGVTGVEKYLFPLTVTFLLLALWPLWVKGRARNNYSPLYLGGFAAMITLIGMFVIVFEPLLYTGVALLVIASVWSMNLDKTKIASCPACVGNEATS